MTKGTLRKRTKDTISWLFNQRDASDAVKVLGARNLTVVKAMYITSDQEEEVAYFDKMVQYSSDEADQKLIQWIQDMVKENKADSRYLYFKFLRWN